MPGYLTDMFQPGAGGEQSDQGQQHLGVTDTFDEQQEADVHTHYAASYEGADGSTHSWEGGQDLTATVGLHAVLDVAADTAQSMTVGDGFAGE